MKLSFQKSMGVLVTLKAEDEPESNQLRELAHELRKNSGSRTFLEKLSDKNLFILTIDIM
ncbi:MAG: hypothetical protein A3B91_04410 [Candidatus Yanofskybacteria bacterium RIFCSPHIGHO2_02_FULL_41_29]|uniref:Uncharacterized protein n=1 Tax=Candidatus Yanofskybacteria bacterium RIFCSPHIGHO2_01_FULL_41_53 TaxID=1802663 RepID=A0A1F8EK97_9BACT|nr:MAG: hypothetical protein A2650_03670 [Candidatus Yanofskybacteria bacterium RIFCSPHIGHO2_01_FULL_41_53]OGN11763.1 MAG: hypothetical protein A3B91_04410 [Candidatus Yanofskybacteria bacterium RIFCSPHIGHO2_02_FULL_41_29]OGN18862.1 MAG: hypothetical protein A3F48_02045 [Candidatus Yanofskybacteria bacterium RIFCSPHIGHO2_12_FULL_41_9]OGN22917.1 MAG: hypothetical protein A2916_00865 [Candidatus Yanofskybacteria bacterium RIFCSPLOWO2_01_FULL_41_67]OGN30194.1 MAG: hypothetical protein A3H54_00920 